ncbi:hypothetical protein BGZ76_002474 [Entomortierella beljakovae]|nr:hypothetical protein BGZ76_002474 [Entomortierella beljakovae]
MTTNDNESLSDGNTSDPSLLEELRLLESDPKETRQGFRAVFRNVTKATTSTLTSDPEEDIIFITPIFDQELEMDVIYWKQIEDKFENALYIQNNFNGLGFIKDFDRDILLLPLRINAILDVTLEVVVENPIDETEYNTLKSSSSMMEYCTERNPKDGGLSTDASAPIQPSDAPNNQGDLQESSLTLADYKTLQCQVENGGRGLTLAKAESGDIEAQTDIGIIYYIFFLDYSKAVEWMFRAANQGYARAQRNIGHRYHFGEGLPKDYLLAMEWYMKAAEQNDPIAQNYVALIYQKRGGIANYAKAMEWFLKSASQGYEGAYKNMGNLYKFGYGVPINYSKALEWYIKAAKQGCGHAICIIGSLYHGGRFLELDLSRAAKWYLRASKQIGNHSQWFIGTMYYRGEYFPQDGTMAMKWYLKAVSQGAVSRDLQIDIAKMYFYGYGVPQDYSESLIWFRKLSLKGDPLAQYYEALFYLYGFEVPLNHPKALELLLMAAEDNPAITIGPIATIYEEGHGVTADYTKAKDWFHKNRLKGKHRYNYRKLVKSEKKRHVITQINDTDDGSDTDTNSDASSNADDPGPGTATDTFNAGYDKDTVNEDDDTFDGTLGGGVGVCIVGVIIILDACRMNADLKSIATFLLGKLQFAATTCRVYLHRDFMVVENICKIVQGYLCGKGRPLYLQPINSDGTYSWLETCRSAHVSSTTSNHAPKANSGAMVSNKTGTPLCKKVTEGSDEQDSIAAKNECL